jgi:hypothetical protein
MKTMVYHFRVWDPATDEMIVPRLKSPADRILNICRGEIIKGTGEQVEVSALDEHGRYDPALSQPKP